jgi:hypothetical protein
MIQSERETVERRIKQAKRWIWVTFSREGIHRYPAAATDPKLCTPGEYDVSFLANAHRHIFHFRVAIEVEHSDRAIEFIQFKRWLENLYSGTGPYNENRILDLDFKSCEMIAEDLYLQIAERYPNRDVKIDVSEDNENGAHIEFLQTRPAQSIVI